MNLDPHVVEWMHARVDGEISERENADLTDFLSRNPEAREYLDELQQLSERLGAVDRVAPPPELRAAVLAAIEPPVARQPRKVRSGGGAVLRYAYAAAAGLIVGVLGYHVATRGVLDRASVDPADLVGTMTSRRAAEEPAVIEELALDLPNGRGAVRLTRLEGGVSMHVDLDSPEAVDVVLAFDPATVVFREFIQDLGEIDSLEVTDETVTWTQHGHHRVAVVLSPRGEAPATVDLRLFTSGELVHGTALRLPGPE